MNSIKHDNGAHADAAAFVTVEEYFDYEAEAERHGGRKSEYIDGRIRPMTEMGVPHIQIHSNLVGLLIVALRGRPFKVLGPEAPLGISADGPYYHPEAIVTPRSLESDHDRGNSSLNPVAVFEVFSPATDSDDRGEKLKNYARVETLRDYVVIAEDRVQVDHFTRDGDGWHMVELNKPTETLPLEAMDIRLKLANIYDRLEFEPLG